MASKSLVEFWGALEQRASDETYLLQLIRVVTLWVTRVLHAERAKTHANRNWNETHHAMEKIRDNLIARK